MADEEQTEAPADEQEQKKPAPKRRKNLLTMKRDDVPRGRTELTRRRIGRGDRPDPGC